MQSTTTAAKRASAKQAAEKRAAKRAAAVRAAESEPVTAEARERIEAKVSSLETFGLELAKVLAHPTDGMASSGESIEPRERQGITIEEIGELLQRRERKGHVLGYQRARDDGRRDLRLALQRERAESVAGALLFCVEQIAPVLKQLADVDRNQIGDAAARASFVAARLDLIELTAAMSQHAQRIADGDQQLAGTGTNTISTQVFPSPYR